MAIKYICDICKKEIKNYGDSYHIKIEQRKLGKPSTQLNEICEECVKKIKEVLKCP